MDLKEFDLLILVDVYKVRRSESGEVHSTGLKITSETELTLAQNVCGMSVVGNDYEKLKRYNLSEIYEPTPKAATD